MKRLDYDDMERGQCCLVYIDTRRGAKSVDIGIVSECHGTDANGEDYQDYEDFTLSFPDGERTFYQYYYNREDQGVDKYTMILYILDDEEIEQHIVLETI